MKHENSENDSAVTALRHNSDGDSVGRSFKWRELQDATIRGNSEYASLHYAMRAIGLVARQMREIRLESGLTQAQLADLADMKQPQISRLERLAEPLSEGKEERADLEESSAESSRVEGPTIGMLARVLAAAGYKIVELKIEPCRVQK